MTAERKRKQGELVSSRDTAAGAQYRYGADGKRAVKYNEKTGGESLYFNTMWDLAQMNGDHLGSAQVVTNHEGMIYERYEYTPYGEAWIEWENREVLRNELDVETGLYYYGARYLGPRASRRLSADPAAGEYVPAAPADDEARRRNGNLPGMSGVYNAVNLHLYHYAGNNPVKYTDPDGRMPFLVVTGLIGMTAGAVYGGVSSYLNNGEIDWDSVRTGALIGGVIGLTGGMTTSLLATAGSAMGITALAGTSTVTAGLGITGGAGGTIVIGQTMSRVIDKAQSIGAEYYNGCAYYQKLSDMFGTKAANFIGKADNALWIVNKMAQDYKIVDIGIDVDKALGNSSYILESVLTFFYQNKEIAIEYFKGAIGD